MNKTNRPLSEIFGQRVSPFALAPCTPVARPTIGVLPDAMFRTQTSNVLSVSLGSRLVELDENAIALPSWATEGSNESPLPFGPCRTLARLTRMVASFFRSRR